MDYYAILSLTKEAGKDDIKKAYKQLAMKYHPDKNQGDEQAEEQFKQVNEAYQILSDPNKKAQYDHILTYGFAQTTVEPEPRPYYKAEPVRPEPRKTDFLYVYIALGFVIFITAGFFFFTFMEKQAAITLHEDAARIYEKENNPRAALEYLELALEKNPALPAANFLMGKILFQEAADYQSSLFYFENAVIEGNGVSDSIGVFYFWRGKAKLQLEKDIEGIQDLEASFAYLPENKELKLLMADAYLYKLKDYEKALFHFDEVLFKEAENYDALLGKGVTLQRKTQYQEAEMYFNNAKLVKPEAPELLYYEALQALNYQKDTLKACNLWRQASANGVKEALVQMATFCTAN